jgi:hypothetical protein
LIFVVHNDVQVGTPAILEYMLNPGRETLPVKPTDERHLYGQVGVGGSSAIRIPAKRTRIRSTGWVSEVRTADGSSNHEQQSPAPTNGAAAPEAPVVPELHQQR